MKKKGIEIAAVFLGGLCALNLFGCAESNLLGKPQGAVPLTYEERAQTEFADLKQGAERFAAQFAAAVGERTEGNFAVAPVSVYMALALAAECAAGDTRQELLSALGVSVETLREDFSDYYRSLLTERKDDSGKVTGRLSLGNSVWVNKGSPVNTDCIQTLAERYYCYSYEADFAGKNASANQAVRNFVKKQTNGSIDQDFNLSEQTVFTLINTLYLKAIWNEYGSDLPYAQGEYTFTQSDGEEKAVSLLQGYYIAGRAVDAETFTHFYATTNEGFRLKFILPKEGYTAAEVFTEENIAYVNALGDYNVYDHENRLCYYTRCLFPEFDASYNEDVKGVLQELGIASLFDSSVCDLSNLTGGAFCNGVRHVTKLTVNKKGIEGAAATVLPMAGSPGPGEYTSVYEDFVVDGAFGFILSDSYGNTVFSGIVGQV